MLITHAEQGSGGINHTPDPRQREPHGVIVQAQNRLGILLYDMHSIQTLCFQHVHQTRDTGIPLVRDAWQHQGQLE